MINYFYSIENSQIDRHFFGQTFVSNDFILIIHEFLKKIYENILILQSHNVFIINNSHLYIKKMSMHNFSYILHGKIYFDMEKCLFYTNKEKNKTTEINLPDVFGIKIILSQIKKLILNKNSNHNDHKLNINDNLNKNIYDNFCYKKLIDNSKTTNENIKSIKKISSDKNVNKKNISIEKEIMHNEIHKLSKLIDPLVVIEKNKIKNREKLLEEKNNEKKRIFTSDLSVYKKIKNDLENNIINDIPPLFLDKYFIFKLLDEDDLLNSNNNYLLFMAMYESDNNSDDEKKNNINIGTIIDTNINKLTDIEHDINIIEEKKEGKIFCTDINEINITKKINKNEKKMWNKNEFDNNIDPTDILNDNVIKKTSIDNYMLETNDSDYGIF